GSWAYRTSGTGVRYKPGRTVFNGGGGLPPRPAGNGHTPARATPPPRRPRRPGATPISPKKLGGGGAHRAVFSPFSPLCPLLWPPYFWAGSSSTRRMKVLGSSVFCTSTEAARPLGVRSRERPGSSLL